MIGDAIKSHAAAVKEMLAEMAQSRRGVGFVKQTVAEIAHMLDRRAVLVLNGGCCAAYNRWIQ